MLARARLWHQAHAALTELLQVHGAVAVAMPQKQQACQQSARKVIDAFFPACCATDSKLQQYAALRRSYAGKRTRRLKEPHAPKFEGHKRVDKQIPGPEVRLVGDGVNAVVPLDEAIRDARSQRLSLVEIASEGKMAVCKIMDYDSFFQQAKKSHDAKMVAHAETAHAVSKSKSIKLGCAVRCKLHTHVALLVALLLAQQLLLRSPQVAAFNCIDCATVMHVRVSVLSQPMHSLTTQDLCQ